MKLVQSKTSRRHKMECLVRNRIHREIEILWQPFRAPWMFVARFEGVHHANKLINEYPEFQETAERMGFVVGVAIQKLHKDSRLRPHEPRRNFYWFVPQAILGK